LVVMAALSFPNVKKKLEISNMKRGMA